MIFEAEYFDGEGNRCPASMPLIASGRPGLICGTGCGFQVLDEQAEQLMVAHMRIAHPGQRWMDTRGVMH